RFEHQVSRGVAVDLLERLRAGNEQDRTFAAIVGLLQGSFHMIERIERAGPVSGGTAIIECGLPGPRDGRSNLGCFLPPKPPGVGIIAPLCFYIKTAQSQYFSFIPPRHFTKSALGAASVTGHLGRLRCE